MNDELVRALQEHDQAHVLRYVDQLAPAERARFEKELAAVDLQQLTELYQHAGAPQRWADLASRAEPPVAIRLTGDVAPSIGQSEAVERGRRALSDGRVALILVAGGQGTRLGFAHPKGMLPLGPVSGRTLFQIHIDKLLAINARYGNIVPLAVMTSPATHEETEQFLEQHDWFGYPRAACWLFCQGTMPAVDLHTGRLLLRARGRLALSPDGHGGMLAAFARSGLFEEFAERGIELVFYSQVDNPLSQLCDDATIGYHLITNSEMTSQAVPKTGPLQPVGNLVQVDGRIRVIEYSDLPEDVARVTNADGSLRLWAGSIAVHVFDLAFLRRMADYADALPFHLARKKVPHLDEHGQRIEPSAPNALKFERFIFDLLPMARHSIVIEVDVAEAFSPVKNAAGEAAATIATAQQALIEQARRRLHRAGVNIAPGVPVEIAPGLMDDAEALRQAAGGTRLDQPVYLTVAGAPAKTVR